MLRRILLAALVATSVAFAGIQYSLTDIGTLGGTSSSAGGLSSNGYVTGWSYTSTGAVHIFLWENGTMIDITPSSMSGDSPIAKGVNSNGDVAGYYLDSNGDHAFVYSNGAFSYPSLGGFQSTAVGINDQGQVTGRAQNSSLTYDGYLYQNGTMTDLSSQYGTEVNAPQAISDGGYIAGNGPNYGFLYNGSSVIELGTLGGTYSNADGVSSNGLVTGWADGSSQNHLAYYTDASATMHQIPGLTSNSTGFGINSSGQVVGVEGGVTPFLYSGGITSNLNDLLATSGWTLTGAYSINDAGQILAQAQNTTTGQSHAVLLTPLNPSAVPEPASIGLFGIGSLGLYLAKKKRS